MNSVAVGLGNFFAEELASFSAPATWRKATRNMIMATASIDRALKPLGLTPEKIAEMGLVLGSNSGELDTSADFLTTLSQSGMARPLLFQNSLHNATTGFASIHFRMHGPSFTVSSGANTPSESLALGQALIADGQVELCAVTLVESHKVLSGLIGVELRQGAQTVILARPDLAESRGWSPLSLSVKDYPLRPASAPLTDISSGGWSV